MSHYAPQYVASCREDLRLLANDITPLAEYSVKHIASMKAEDGGAAYRGFLREHDNSVNHAGELMIAVKKLLWAGGSKCQSTMTAYHGRETENVTEVKGVWEKLGQQGEMVYPGPDPVGTPTLKTMPSAGLPEPKAGFEHWIFQVLSWPDYLSVGSWVRKIIGWLWSWTHGGEDPWAAIWYKIGGDYTKVGRAGVAWTELSEAFDEMGQDVASSAQEMFKGWYDSDGSTAASAYFTRAATGISGVKGPLSELGTLYTYVAWSSFSFFQAIFSLIDAAIDAIVAFITGGVSLLEAVAAVFSGGLTAIPAATSAVIATIEALSAAWGFMMTAVYTLVGLGTLLGAATTEVTWVTVPEG